MLIDKPDQICDECGEPMVLVNDYGVSGQAFECRLCGYSVEEIDLRTTILDRV